MKITEKQVGVLRQVDHRVSIPEILICLNNTIDEAQKKICENLDRMLDEKLTSDKVAEGVMADLAGMIMGKISELET